MFKFKFIKAAGNILTSESTEYLPPMKFLCSIISASNLLPIPTEIKEAQKEISNFEKKLQKSVTEDSSSSASSTEESILKQIQNN